MVRRDKKRIGFAAMPTEVIYVYVAGKGNDGRVPALSWESGFDPIFDLYSKRADEGVEVQLYRVELGGPRRARADIIYYLTEQVQGGYPFVDKWDLIATNKDEGYTNAVETAITDTVTRQLRIVKELGGDPIALVVAALKSQGMWEELVRTAKEN